MKPRTTGTLREKKSFTLSPSSLAFLERFRKRKRLNSTSLALDHLIREAEAADRRASTEEAIASYYSTLTDAEQREQEAWGEFAQDQFRRSRD